MAESKYKNMSNEELDEESYFLSLADFIAKMNIIAAREEISLETVIQAKQAMELERANDLAAERAKDIVTSLTEIDNSVYRVAER